MLKDIENIVKEKGAVASADIAVRLGSSIEAVEGMLEFLERKEHVKRAEAACSHGCAGCSCDGPTTESKRIVWSIK